MSDKSKIAIIGAGFAGLAAAQVLRENNYDAFILEARDRVGGRAYSVNNFGFPFDIGAFLIHGVNKNPIAELFNKNHLHYMLLDQKSIYLTGLENEKSIANKQIASLNEKYFSMLKHAANAARSMPSDISLFDAINNFKKNLTNDFLFQAYLKWMSNWLGLYFGTELQNISSRYWDEEEQLSGGNQLIPGGYTSIIKILARDLKILFNQPVKTINYGGKKIIIETQNDVYQVDAAIITVSLGVLKSNAIEFHPALPRNKIEAIEKLQMGTLDKIALKFPRLFWPQDMLQIASFNCEIPIFINYYPIAKKNILMGMLAGSKAVAIEKLSDEEIVDYTVQQLKLIFGNQVVQPEEWLITRWSSDPYSFGSYSYLPTETTPKAREQLTLPINNQIFFAGEASHSLYPATTHGAYLSGIREAQRLMALNPELEVTRRQQL